VGIAHVLPQWLHVDGADADAKHAELARGSAGEVELPAGPAGGSAVGHAHQHRSSAAGDPQPRAAGQRAMRGGQPVRVVAPAAGHAAALVIPGCADLGGQNRFTGVHQQDQANDDRERPEDDAALAHDPAPPRMPCFVRVPDLRAGRAFQVSQSPLVHVEVWR